MKKLLFLMGIGLSILSGVVPAQENGTATTPDKLLEVSHWE